MDVIEELPIEDVKEGVCHGCGETRKVILSESDDGGYCYYCYVCLAAEIRRTVERINRLEDRVRSSLGEEVQV